MMNTDIHTFCAHGHLSLLACRKNRVDSSSDLHEIECLIKKYRMNIRLLLQRYIWLIKFVSIDRTLKIINNIL